MGDNPLRTGEMLKNLERLKRDLPILLANQARRFFVAKFKSAEWDKKPWKEVKRRIEGTKEYRYPKMKGLSRRTSPILVRTGKMRSATNNSIRSQTFSLIKLVVATEYASYNNDGTATIPERRFIGDSIELRREQIKLIDNQLNKLNAKD